MNARHASGVDTALICTVTAQLRVGGLTKNGVRAIFQLFLQDEFGNQLFTFRSVFRLRELINCHTLSEAQGGLCKTETVQLALYLMLVWPEVHKPFHVPDPQTDTTSPATNTKKVQYALKTLSGESSEELLLFFSEAK